MGTQAPAKENRQEAYRRKTQQQHAVPDEAPVGRQIGANQRQPYQNERHQNQSAPPAAPDRAGSASPAAQGSDRISRHPGLVA